jgi:hypothetical protein
MDSLKCVPIFEVRDSQSANSDLNKFGGHSAETVKSRSPDTPGPPFHVAQANLNLDVDPSSFGYLSNTSGDSPQYQLPNRNRTATRPGQMGYNSRFVALADSLSPGSEEGRSPSMNNDQQSTRSSSYKDSSSHTSFTPPSMDDSQQAHRQNSVQTPSTMSNSSSIQTPSAMDATNNGNAFYNFNMDASFSNFQPGFLGQTAEPVPTSMFQAQSGWEMSGIEVSSGMTPMAEQPWSQMLEGIQDWGGDLMTSQYDASGRRAS